MPLLHSRHVDRRVGCLLAIFLRLYKLVEFADGKQYCKLQWDEAFGWSLSFSYGYLVVEVVFLYIPIALLIILYSAIVVKRKTQKIIG